MSARDTKGNRRVCRVRMTPRLPSPKILFALLVVCAFIVLGYQVRSDFARAVDHLSVGRLPWLAVAVGAEGLSFLCYAAVQRRLLLTGGAKLTRRTMLGLAVAATGLTNLVPGGTAPASGWLVNQYRRRGIPMPLALWCVLVGGFAAAIAILVLLLAGAAVARLTGAWETVGLSALLVSAVVALVVAIRHVLFLDRWLDRHATLPGSKSARRGLDAAAKVLQFRTTPARGAVVLVLSLSNWGLDTGCLIAAFEVLGFAVPWKAVLFAYAAAQVAGSLAPVPGGIGFVEGGMVGAFALAGVQSGDAFVATLVYRMITCWAVAAVGSLALLVLNSRPPVKAELRGGPAGTSPANSRLARGMKSKAAGSSQGRTGQRKKVITR